MGVFNVSNNLRCSRLNKILSNDSLKNIIYIYIYISSSSCYDDTNYLVRSSSRPTAHFHSVRFCASLFEAVIDIPTSPQSSCMLSSHLLLGRPRGRVPCSCPYSKIFVRIVRYV